MKYNNKGKSVGASYRYNKDAFHLKDAQMVEGV
jgi:hypothetical protein